MRLTPIPTYVYLAAVICCACSQTSDQLPYQDNVELANLYQADQADRSGSIEDWTIVSENDRKRRARVLEMLEADSLVTANDYYHAAMVFQHGEDSVAYKLAWDLAEKAVSLDSIHTKALWLTAAAADRYLLSIDKLQIYGTQFMIYLDVWYLQRIDPEAVSDADRQGKGTRTLQEIEAFLAEQNGEDRGLNIVPDSILSAIQGM